jgi:choline-sulfatase
MNTSRATLDCGQGESQKKMTEPRNLVFILSDNHNRAFAGPYGHPQAVTPNLDALAARGVVFENAYAASPLCCPSRASLATGRYPHQTGYWDNAITFDGRVPSWMRRLRDRGHDVVSFGKLHFRSSADDNGFSEERLAMHILDGKGGTHMLLRGFDDEHVNTGQWEMYRDRTGIGTAPYQAFDQKITEDAIGWLEAHGREGAKPFALFVSYPSTHPPFAVPAAFWDRIDAVDIRMPSGFLPAERSEHPADRHLRHIMGTSALDEDLVRRIQVGYLALVAHLDHEIGRLLHTLEALSLTDDTRIVYTSDHGDLAGQHGLLGKFCLYEGSIGVPLIMAGPGIPAGRRVKQVASHVDLFPTILEGLGCTLEAEDADVPGRSLWPAIQGEERDVIGFAEYHAVGSKVGSFMLRHGNWKLIYHVGMPTQLFDLEADPDECRDLGPDHPEAARLEAMLRNICDPEAVDARAKADQRAKADFWGGREAVAADGLLVFTPPPGVAAEVVR